MVDKLNAFSSFELSERDTITSQVLTALQMQGLHNLRSEIAEQMLIIDIDPEKPSEFIQTRAKLNGLLEAYSYLIEASLAAAQILNNPETVYSDEQEI